MNILPHVRFLLLCEDAVVFHKQVSIIRLISSIQPRKYPHIIRQLGMFLSLSGGRGQARLTIVGYRPDSLQVLFTSPEYVVTFDPDPLVVQGVFIKLKAVKIHQQGLVVVECRMNGTVIGQQNFVMKEASQ